MERIGLTFNPSRMGSGATDDDLITVAKLADQLGYDTFFTGESWGPTMAGDQRRGQLNKGRMSCR